MPTFVSEVTSSLAERPECLGFLDQLDAWKHLLEVGGVAGAVVRTVKQAVDVVEDVFLLYLGAI